MVEAEAEADRRAGHPPASFEESKLCRKSKLILVPCILMSRAGEIKHSTTDDLDYKALVLSPWSLVLDSVVLLSRLHPGEK